MKRELTQSSRLEMANEEDRKEILEIQAWNWMWNKDSEKSTSKKQGIPSEHITTVRIIVSE